MKVLTFGTFYAIKIDDSFFLKNFLLGFMIEIL